MTQPTSATASSTPTDNCAWMRQATAGVGAFIEWTDPISLAPGETSGNIREEAGCDSVALGHVFVDAPPVWLGTAVGASVTGTDGIHLVRSAPWNDGPATRTSFRITIAPGTPVGDYHLTSLDMNGHLGLAKIHVSPAQRAHHQVYRQRYRLRRH